MELFARLYLPLITVYVLAFCVSGVLSWKCGNGDYIPDEFRCDDQNDCSDGTDELKENCEHKVCGESLFRCRENYRCIHNSFVCNGEPDCLDGDFSDELNCTDQHFLHPEGVGGCPNGKFKCRTGDLCLSFTWVCDEERDCLDASDESSCPCKGDAFSCLIGGTSLCLKNATKCDGIEHCDGGEDEQGCLSINSRDGYGCPDGRFKCRSKNQCLSWKMVCDGTEDCQDGSDEGGRCHLNACGHRGTPWSSSKKACEHRCHESPDGPHCRCNSGFRLAGDGLHCLDVDECAEMLSAELHNSRKLARLFAQGVKQICSQTCLNRPGGFTCGCVDGYAVDPDGVTCKALGIYDPELYVVIGSQIRVLSLRDPGHHGMHYDIFYRSEDPEERIVDVDVSVSASAVFWVEKSGMLKRKDGRGTTTFSLDFQPNAVAVDWISGNLLVSTKKLPRRNYGSPAVCLLAFERVEQKDEMTLTAVIELITSGLYNPVSLAVSPKKGLLLVADYGNSFGTGARLVIANFDGSDVRSLVRNNLVGPVDVIIDELQEAAIWASYNPRTSEAKVESVKLDGSQRGVIMSRKANWFPVEPVSTAVFENYLYVSDRKAGEVRYWNTTRISLYGDQNLMRGSKGLVKLERGEKLGAIKIAHPVLQPKTKGESRCRSAGCSHACVMVPTSRSSMQLTARCLCPTKRKLSADKKTCDDTKSPVTSSSSVSGNKPPVRKLPATTTAATTTIFIPEITTTIARRLSALATSSSVKAPMLAICASPELVANSKMESKREYMGSDLVQTIRYWCSKGYVIKAMQGRREGRYKITCLPDGNWDSLPPVCVPEVRATQKTVHESSLTKLLDHVRQGVTELVHTLNPAKEPSTKSTSCDALRCRPWGNCTKISEENYQCVCTYEESTSPSISACLPPTSPTFDTTAAPDTPSGLASWASALVAMVVIFVLLLVMFLCYRTMRRTQHSIDLRYFKSGKFKHLMTPLNSRDSEIIEASATGKLASVTNPNYNSPQSRPKRLLKPTYGDDKDSGILPSLSGSGSPSPTSDDNFGRGACAFSSREAAQLATERPLLVEEMHCAGEDDDAISEISIDDLGNGRRGRFAGKLNFFKLRRTESRECMLPKQKALRKSLRTSFDD